MAPIAEILGWKPAAGYDDRRERPGGGAYLDGDGYTVDDLLAWLREQGWSVGPAYYDEDEPAAPRLTDVPVVLNVYDDTTSHKVSAPTLLAALEDAVRAVVVIP